MHPNNLQLWHNTREICCATVSTGRHTSIKTTNIKILSDLSVPYITNYILQALEFQVKVL